MSDQQVLDVVVDTDLLSNQFLVSGDLTRALYDPGATFTDEIDSYTLDQWIKGTSRLFDAGRSKVLLVPGSARVERNSSSNSNSNANSVLSFRFVEYLCFNIPVIKPISYLSGTLFLERSPTTGLIVSYRERWDQDTNTVLTQNSRLFTNGVSNEELDRDLEAFAAKTE
mmetsp:Transcript_15442/g.33306  ORF Transcript_15442/g.33306 Transcript_15442/m.33306 type:complete len:169 (-) Transcript_15442:5-511(-)